MKSRIPLGFAALLAAAVLNGCGGTAPETSAPGADQPPFTEEVRAIDTYPGERFDLDYKGTVILEGRAAMPDAQTVRIMPLDETGAQIPHRAAGSVIIASTGAASALAQQEGKAYLETRLPSAVEFPTTVSLALEVDAEIPGTAEIVLTGTTPGAFD